MMKTYPKGKSGRKSLKASRRLDTDTIMKTTYQLFLRDMRDVHGVDFLLKEEAALISGVREFRNYPWSRCYLTTPHRFKAKYQAENYFKRYITRDDEPFMDRVAQETKKKFLETQIRISEHWKGDIPYRSKLVLQKARSYIRSVLGEYDSEKHKCLCRPGKRAAVGLNYRESYLDNRLVRLTGSPQQQLWWDSFVADDNVLQFVLKDLKSRRAVTKYLKLDVVPKNWKAFRCILKNTVIGGYYTAGLGDYIVKQWKDFGYDLSRRPDLHSKWVKGFSKDRSHATGDLSSASDSYVAQLLNMLFPRKWYNAMKLGRIKTVEIDGELTTMESFMTMGIGFTFPVQSLGFYAILHAIQELSGVHGRISVFGDDLIYPTKMHRFVSGVLNDLGFILNQDKTYVHEEFRESCGSDYYTGRSVRPFQPEGSAEELCDLELLSYLYSTLNGWWRRWEREEIPRVSAYLISEICLLRPTIHRVPYDFPDYSGVRLRTPDEHRDLPWSKIIYSGSPGNRISFETIGITYNLRKVEKQSPYYWDSLRKLSFPDEPEVWAFRRNKLKRKLKDKTDLIWKPVFKHRNKDGFILQVPNRQQCANVVEKGAKVHFNNQVGTSVFWS